MTKKSSAIAVLLGSAVLPILPSAMAQDMTLEEIVVTSRKREESLMEIPVAVTALTQDQLDRAGISTPDELSNLTPGLSYQGLTTTSGRFAPDIRFRGMIQQIITPSTQAGALFWDGSYIGAGGGFLPLGDLERVEVIKGPQTAYFGRNTFTGAVNYIPKLPGDVWEGDGSIEYSPSDGDSYYVEAGVGGPITDKVGIRIWGGYKDTGGDFFTKDGERYGWAKDKSVSGTMTFEPSDSLRLKATGYYTRATTSGQYGGVNPLTPGAGGTAAFQCNRTYTGEYLNPATGVKTPFTRDLRLLNVAAWCGNYPDGEFLEFPSTLRPRAGIGQSILGDNRLTALTTLHPMIAKYGIVRQPGGRLGDFDQTYRIQFSGEYDIADHTLAFNVSRANTGLVTLRDFQYGVPSVANGVQVIGTNTAVRDLYYEARITSPQDGRLRYLVGISEYNQHYRDGEAPFSNQLTVGGPGVVGTLPPVDFQNGRTFGIFGSVDYDFTDELTLSVEARYAYERSKVIIQGDPNLRCSFSPVCNEVSKNKDFIPRVIVSYTPFDGATTYASYSYSTLLGVPTQAGFINFVAPEVIPASQLAALGIYTPPQENEQFEVGWKQQLENWSFTFAAFHADWTNQPFASVIPLTTGGSASFRGPGDSKYKGFELEVNGNVSDWLNLAGTVGYSHAVMTNFSSRGSHEQIVLGSGNLSVVSNGNTPRHHTPWTASFSPTFMGTVADRPWFFRTDFFYESATWVDYSEFDRTQSQLLINVRAGIDYTENVTFEVFGRNITHDKTLPRSASTTNGVGIRKAITAIYRKPEYGVRFVGKF